LHFGFHARNLNNRFTIKLSVVPFDASASFGASLEASLSASLSASLGASFPASSYLRLFNKDFLCFK
jgi:hypothetical protein